MLSELFWYCIILLSWNSDGPQIDFGFFLVWVSEALIVVLFCFFFFFCCCVALGGLRSLVNCLGAV